MPFHQHISIPLPTTALCWQSLIESACGDNTIINYAWLGEQVLKVQKSYSGSYTATAHAVCALIVYLESSSASSPSKYLGISSPSCSSCHAWIDGYNSIGGRQYRTRGSNGSWCFPWAMPILRLATKEQHMELSTHMVTLVAAEYAAYWTAQGKLCSPNDCPTGVPIVQDPVTRRQALVAKSRSRGW